LGICKFQNEKIKKNKKVNTIKAFKLFLFFSTKKKV